MILCNLAVLLAERKLKVSKVAQDTGISRTPLPALYHGSGKGIHFDTVNQLCIYLGVDLGELFTTLPFDLFVEGCNLIQDADNRLLARFSCRLLYRTQTEFPILCGAVVVDNSIPEFCVWTVDFPAAQDDNSQIENMCLTDVFRKLTRPAQTLIETRLELAAQAAAERLPSTPAKMFGEPFQIDFHFPDLFTRTDAPDLRPPKRPKG